MRSRYFVRAKSALRGMLKTEKDPKKRDDIYSILKDIDRGIFSYEEAIEAAKMIGVRNPAFDGDYIGCPEDDFDDDEDDDKKKKRR